MTVREAIAYLDDVKPNAFTEAVKLRWINQIEGRLASEVFLMAPPEMGQFDYTADEMDHGLLLDAPYDDIYTWWLQAQADLANGEYDRAQNTMTVFNDTWHDFVRWFCQRYDPAQGYISEGKR